MQHAVTALTVPDICSSALSLAASGLETVSLLNGAACAEGPCCLHNAQADFEWVMHLKTIVLRYIEEWSTKCRMYDAKLGKVRSFSLTKHGVILQCIWVSHQRLWGNAWFWMIWAERGAKAVTHSKIVWCAVGSVPLVRLLRGLHDHLCVPLLP